MHVYKQLDTAVLAIQFTTESRATICSRMPKNITTMPQTNDIVILYEPTLEKAYVVNLYDWIVQEGPTLKVLTHKEFVKKYDVVPYPRTTEKVEQQETPQQNQEN